MCKPFWRLQVEKFRWDFFFFWGIYFTLNFKNPYLYHTKWNQILFSSLWSWRGKLGVWEFLGHLKIKSFRGFFFLLQGVKWFVANILMPIIWQFNILLVNLPFCTLQMEKCHTINKCGDIWILVVIYEQKLQKMWFVLHDLLPHFVLLGLHLFSCLYVGWDINLSRG